MPVKKLEILEAAGLIRLNLTPSEINKLAAELSGILDYVERIDEVDSIKIGHNIKCVFNKVILREDKVVPSLSEEKVFESAPAKNKDFFKVPKVIRQE